MDLWKKVCSGDKAVMFHVITGGSGSGKSVYAENCILQYHKESQTDKLFYIATMEPFGKEMERKIERHRVMRSGKGFDTIECYQNLEHAADFIQAASGNSSVLLECMSNLAANEFYKVVLEKEQTQEAIDEIVESIVIEKIWSGLYALLENCKNLVLVTNEVCSDGEVVSKEMNHYKKILSAINRKIAGKADRVTEVVYGIPCEIAGTVSDMRGAAV